MKMVHFALGISLICTSNSWGVVNSLSVAGDGVSLSTVTVDGRVYSLADLIGVTLTTFDSDSAGVLLTQGNNGLPQVPSPGSRATLIQDNRLDTGVINQGRAADDSTVVFGSAIYNRPGTDIFLLEFDPTSENGNDGLQVRINGITKSYPTSEGILLLADLTSDVFSSNSGTVDSLFELENDAFSRTSENVTQSIFGYSIDLSDFGIASGGSVTSMQFGSASSTSVATIDPVFIAGLTYIPEPATASLGLLGLAGLMMRRRRMA